MAITESPNCWLSGLGGKLAGGETPAQARWSRQSQQPSHSPTGPPWVFGSPILTHIQTWGLFCKVRSGAGANHLLQNNSTVEVWKIRELVSPTRIGWDCNYDIKLQQNAELNWYEPIFKANNIHRFPDQFWGFTILPCQPSAGPMAPHLAHQALTMSVPGRSLLRLVPTVSSQICIPNTNNV